MGLMCCVRNCVNHHSRKHHSAVIHRFPENIPLREIWIQRVSTVIGTQLAAKSHHGVCSLHFEDSDYCKLTTHGKPAKTKKRSLLATAVPFKNGESCDNNGTATATEEACSGSDYESIRSQLRIAQKSLSKKSILLKSKEIIIAGLETTIHELQAKTLMQDKKIAEFETFDLAVRKIFSEKQIQCIIGQNAFVHWTESDMSKAIAINSISSRSYN